MHIIFFWGLLWNIWNNEIITIIYWYLVFLPISGVSLSVKITKNRKYLKNNNSPNQMSFGAIK